MENIGKKQTKIHSCSSALYDVSSNDDTPRSKARWM